MTPRERKATEGMSATAATPGAASMPQPPPAAHNGSSANGSRVPSWAEWFQCASATQRSELLALAQTQGLIYSHQLPVPTNGVHHKSPPQDIALNPALAQLLAGKMEDLAPVFPGAVAYLDQHLDAGQREAVARALFSPDVFLLLGHADAGTLRVLVEILQQTAARGERLLLLAHHGDALDAVLTHLSHSRHILSLRFQGPGETPLAPELLPLTLANRRHAFKDQTLDGAAKARAEAEAQVAQRQTEAPCWDSLRKLVHDIANARLRLEECRARLNKLPEEVQHAASCAAGEGPFATAIADVTRIKTEGQQALKNAIQELTRQHEAAQAESDELRKAVKSLFPLAEAKRLGRWWTFAWWHATLRGQTLVKMTELENRRNEVEATSHVLETKQRENEDKERQLNMWFESERARLLVLEIERRRQESEKQEHDIRRELEQLTGAWQSKVTLLERPDLRPKEPSKEALDAALASWEKQRQLDTEACQFAYRWADYLAKAGDQLAARIPNWADVIAGTLTALHTDRSFADSAAGPFDRIVLLEADHFSEAEIIRAARRGVRLIMVAQAQGRAEKRSIIRSINGTHAAASGAWSARAGCFQKIWQGLHCDSHRLYYAWTWENGRLCCMLRPVSDQDRGHIEIEHVADFPEIELRILARPKAAPLLAQVVFPPAMSILQAKEFIYRELEEVAVHGQGCGAWLADEPDRYLFHLSPTSLADTISLDLEKGLREWVAPATGNTCCLEFTKADGWSRPQVDQWLSRHLQLRDLARTMALQTPQR
jgi:hypothetical protein